MIRYLYYQVYTKEIPNELSLGISVLGCPIHCSDCHSPHVWDINSKGIGKDLTTEELNEIINKQKWVSCILFFGGEWDLPYLKNLLTRCKELSYKTALYSGYTLDWFNTNFKDYSLYLDYIKVGKYNSKYGSLEYPSTNQRLYDIKNNKDITNLFWKTNIK